MRGRAGGGIGVVIGFGFSVKKEALAVGGIVFKCTERPALALARE